MIQIDSDKIVKLYEYYNSRVMGYIDWSYEPTDKSIEAIEKFLQHKTVSAAWIKRYFAYQFYYWSYGKRNLKGVMLNWVIGAKAIRRYQSIEPSDWSGGVGFLRMNFGIEPDAANKILGIELPLPNVTKAELASVEDSWRASAVGTELGLANCIDYTEMFDENNLICMRCGMSERCSSIKRSMTAIS